MMENKTGELIKVQGNGKEYLARMIVCESDNCNENAETKVYDGKFYCGKHGEEKVGNFVKTATQFKV